MTSKQFFSPQKRASHAVGRGNPSQLMAQARMMIKSLNFFDTLAPVPEFSTFQDVTCVSLKQGENLILREFYYSAYFLPLPTIPSKPEAKDISA
jgi:hypothetical protein